MSDRSETVLRIPFTTMVKVVFFLLLVLITIRLWPVIIMLAVSTLLAVVLEPVVCWMEARGASRAWAVAIIAIALVAMLAAFFFGLVPVMVTQLGEILHSLPVIAGQISRSFPAAAPLVNAVASGAQHLPSSPQIRSWLARGLVAGMYVVEGVTAILFVVVTAIYLLLEGRRAFAWLVSFAPDQERKKLVETGSEASVVAMAYMRGQVITCVLCSAYVLVTLLVLRIPAAAALAGIAFVADLIPVVGTIAMTVPAVLIALTVSPAKALMVVIAYGFYHLLENYLIIPRVYGRQMRLSTLTVLIAVTVGGVLQGVVGAVLVLPLVAVYPIVERIWLRRHLPSDTVKKHEAIEGDDEAVSERASESVLAGAPSRDGS